MQNSNNEEHFIVEPNIESHSVYKLTEHKEAIEKSDIIVFLVAHDEFKMLSVEQIRKYGKNNNILFDIKYLFNARQTDGRL